MHLSVLRNVVLLLGSSAVLQALTIPIANGDGLALPQELPRAAHNVVDLDARSPAKGKGGGSGGGKTNPPKTNDPPKTTDPPKTNDPPKTADPPKTSDPPKTTTQPKTTTSTSTTSTSTTSTSTTSTSTTSTSTTSTSTTSTSTTTTGTSTSGSSTSGSSTSASSTTTPTSSVVALPYKKAPQPTEGWNICNAVGIDCLNDVDTNYEEEIDGSASNVTFPDNSTETLARRSYAKRSRDPNDVPFSSGAVTIKSKDYYTSGELYDTSKNGGKVLKEAWADFKDDLDTDYHIKPFESKPNKKWKGGSDHTYATEHIVELQSIKRFLMAVTKTTDKEKDPIKLSKTADPKWFTENWMKDVSTKVSTRPHKFAAYTMDNRFPDTTLNDLIFEAMGSKRNVENFLLCESSINSAKAKLWGNEDPIAKKTFEMYAKDGASGAIPGNRAISELRTVMAVFEYLNEKGIADKMQKTIANVKTELDADNIAYLLGTKPTDGTADLDLKPMWVEYMGKLLQRVQKKGQDFMADRTKVALDFYKTAKKDLKAASDALEKEDKEADPKKKQKLQNDRIQDRNKLVKNQDTLQKAVKDAEADLLKAIQDLEDAAVKVAAASDKKAERTAQGYNAKKNTVRRKSKAEYDARAKWGLNEREIAKLDRPALDATIKDVEDVINALTALQTAGKGITVPKAE